MFNNCPTTSYNCSYCSLPLHFCGLFRGLPWSNHLIYIMVPGAAQLGGRCPPPLPLTHTLFSKCEKVPIFRDESVLFLEWHLTFSFEIILFISILWLITRNFRLFASAICNVCGICLFRYSKWQKFIWRLSYYPLFRGALPPPPLLRCFCGPCMVLMVEHFAYHFPQTYLNTA